MTLPSQISDELSQAIYKALLPGPKYADLKYVFDQAARGVFEKYWTRYQAETGELGVVNDKLHNEIDRLKADNAELRAEIDRLCNLTADLVVEVVALRKLSDDKPPPILNAIDLPF